MLGNEIVLVGSVHASPVFDYQGALTRVGRGHSRPRSDYAERFPCEECRDHFSALVADHPFPLEHVATDEEARVWTWLTHNIVNRRLGKPWFPYAAAPR